MDNKSQTQKTATVFLSEIFFLKEGDIVSKCFQRVNQSTCFVLHYLREYMLINYSRRTTHFMSVGRTLLLFSLFPSGAPDIEVEYSNV